MGGIFGVASKSDCVMDPFFGVDYHSHLGTKRGGMAVSDGESFSRARHNIENSPFRTKFEHDVEDLHGNLGIGCISDEDPQPLLIQSHLGSFAITTVGKISNQKEIIEELYKSGPVYFLEQSGSRINSTEITAVLINSARYLFRTVVSLPKRESAAAEAISAVSPCKIIKIGSDT